MKTKVFFLVCFLISFCYLSAFPTVINKVYAQEIEYKRVVNEKTPFFLDEKGADILFYLPKGYYIRVLSVKNNILHVECFGSGGTPMLDGYVEKNSVIDCLSPVENPFLSLQIKTSSSCVLYDDANLTKEVQFLFKDRTLFYYGKAVSDNGQNLLFVYYNGKIGYVKETDVYPFSVPSHPEPLNLQNSTTPSAQTEISSAPSNEQFNGLKTAVVVCLFLAGVIALCVALKKKGDPFSCLTYLDDDNAD